MGLLQKLLRKPIEDLSAEVSREARAKTHIVIQEVFKAIDESSPVMADLLAGNEVDVIVTVDPVKVRVKLCEVHVGSAFTGPKS